MDGFGLQGFGERLDLLPKVLVRLHGMTLIRLPCLDCVQHHRLDEHVGQGIAPRGQQPRRLSNDSFIVVVGQDVFVWKAHKSRGLAA